MSQSVTSPQPRWYVLQSKPRHEIRALESLWQHHYKCVLPMLSGEQLRPGFDIGASEPLFSRYLFVQLDSVEGQARELRNIQGVSRILQMGDARYPAVPDWLISSFMGKPDAGEGRRHDGDAIMPRGLGASHLLDRIYQMTDGVARSLALVESICQPPRHVVVAAPLRIAA